MNNGLNGQKTGGWYDQQQPSRSPQPCSAKEALLAHKATGKALLSADEIAMQLVSKMVAEGKTILDEGIACRSIDLDEVHGYDFPRLRARQPSKAKRIKIFLVTKSEKIF